MAVNVLPSQDRARVEKAKADIAIMGNALEMYRLERFNYPNSEMGLRALLKSDEDNIQNFINTRGYIKSLPKDPWGNEYGYRFPSQKGQRGPDIFSKGADGQENTADDVGNWKEE